MVARKRDRQELEEDTQHDEPDMLSRLRNMWEFASLMQYIHLFGKILKIEHSHQPYTLRSASSEAVVAAVVELKGGRSEELGIQPGDQIDHPFFKTAK